MQGTMRHIGILVMIVAMASGAACGTEEPTDTPPTWSPLVTKSWTLQPGEERTSDLQIVDLDRDIYIGGMRPLAPAGTHHTLLYRGVTGTNMVYASGVGTGELTFPEGKGYKLEAGTLLGLQLHIYNLGDTALSGMSGIEILEVDPTSVTDEVDLFLPGPRDLAIPPNQTSTATGTCTVTQPYQVFALFPHMHQLGTHFKTTLTVSGTEQILHDDVYSFEHQAVLSFAPIPLSAGDKITTECTWNNVSSTTVSYGESSTTEMCYSIMYRFPRGTEEFCTQ